MVRLQLDDYVSLPSLRYALGEYLFRKDGPHLSGTRFQTLRPPSQLSYQSRQQSCPQVEADAYCESSQIGIFLDHRHQSSSLN